MIFTGNKIVEFCTSASCRINCYRMMLIVVLGALAYSNTLDSPFVFDDFANIVGNQQVMSSPFSGSAWLYFSKRAVGIVTFQLNYFFFGLNVYWYHITNICIHLAAALTVYGLLHLLLQTPYMVDNMADSFSRSPLPFFAALLFVAHPVQTQAVTYIVQRFSSLATLFYFVATVAYLKARLSQVSSRRQLSFSVFGWFSAALIFVFLAFHTKEITYTLPLAILLIELLFFRCSLKKICWLVAVCSSVAVAILLRYAGKIQSLQNAVTALDEATRVQTIISRSDYLLTQFRVIMTYVRLIFLPIKQRLEYDYSLSHSFFEWQVFCSFLIIVALLLTACWLVKRSVHGSPYLRLVAFGIFWFFLALSVESSVIPIIDLIFEHRLYLPSFGAITAVSALGIALSWRREKRYREWICIIFLLISTLLALVTYQRNSAWKSEVSLWTDAVEKSPGSARAWHQLGAAYIKNREPLNSLKATVRSLELDRQGTESWNNLGIALDHLGAYNDRFNRTTEMFATPESITEKNVNSWQGEVINNFGLAYEVIGNLSKAAECYRNALGFNPSLGLAYYNLGIVSAKMGDYAKYSEQKQILWMLDPALAARLMSRVEKR